MGRPNGYDLHKEMGDVFITVSPTGLTLIVADPKVAAHVNSKRAEFSKPPNTGGECISRVKQYAWRSPELRRTVCGAKDSCNLPPNPS